ncbi:unnamed protein product [Dovyalis caffra]|uniref:Uncharacterized protein n=1 Tax=Dovyalis caffra TaxID=77055 RepID=A0AAV1RRP5_9ROSI|nr:unnamed protein product [Dovyalis caffra]
MNEDVDGMILPMKPKIGKVFLTLSEPYILANTNKVDLHQRMVGGYGRANS